MFGSWELNAAANRTEYAKKSTRQHCSCAPFLYKHTKNMATLAASEAKNETVDLHSKYAENNVIDASKVENLSLQTDRRDILRDIEQKIQAWKKINI